MLLAVAVPLAVPVLPIVGPSVSVTPEAGAPGTPVTVAITGFDACSPPSTEPASPSTPADAPMLRLEPDPQSAGPSQRASTYDGPTEAAPDSSTPTSDPSVEISWSQVDREAAAVIGIVNGSAETNLTVPETAEPGELLVAATCVTDRAITASAVFIVEPVGQTTRGEPVPDVTLNPSTGSPGTSVDALATGFDLCLPGGLADGSAGSVEFSLTGADVALGVKGLQHGSASESFTLPETQPLGSHTLVVRCISDDGLSARATFTVTAPRKTRVLVPKLIGMTVEQAAAELVDEDLALGRVRGDGDVIDAQSPRPGDRAPVGSRVDVSLAPPGPSLVVVPDVMGLAASDAAKVIKGAGLVLGTRSGDGDTVRQQAPPAGSRVPLGTAVDISVERNVPPRSWITVPDVRGKNGEEATAVLESVGLVPGGEIDAGSEVSGQEPAPGTLVLTGAVVDLATPPDAALWPMLLAALGLVAAGALAAYQGGRARRDRRWLRKHIRLEPRPAQPRHNLMGPRDGSSAATTVIRLEPQVGSTAERFEEVSR